jgi:hypothetical protein
MGALRFASTSDQRLRRLIPWFDPRHDFCHAIGSLALPYMALTHAVRYEQ